MDKKEKVVARIGYRFILSCILNIAWILAWHYHQILLSVLIMLGLLATLISIFQKIHSEGIYGNKKARWFVYAPFSIYLGWISIATIANITAYLVSIGWSGWNVEQWIWTIIMIIAGTLLGIAMLVRRNNVFYALTIVWSFAGIILKQRAVSGTLNAIAITALCSAVLLLLLAAWKLRTLSVAKETVGNKHVN